METLGLKKIRQITQGHKLLNMLKLQPSSRLECQFQKKKDNGFKAPCIVLGTQTPDTLEIL